MFNIPKDVKNYVKKHFARCNSKVSYDLSVFPGIHEEALDMRFIGYFAGIQGPIKFKSNWIIRIDAHFIGGGRHFGTWEVADIGLMVIFRYKGKVVRSKIVFLQSKKLYPNLIRFIKDSSYIRRFGLGRLLVTEEEHNEIITPKLLRFDEESKYKAFQKEDEQQRAMSSFEEMYGMKMHYLFYNPLLIPHNINMPLSTYPKLGRNKVGCRVVPKDDMDKALKTQIKKYSPSYADIKNSLRGQFQRPRHKAGWKLQYFVSELMLECKEGMIDDSPDFKEMVKLFNNKMFPMSSSLSITFEMNERLIP